MKTISIVKQWMSLATVEEQQLLAERAGTSRGYLYQLAGGHRQASAELGAAIERESKAMARASKGRLPVIYRTDIVAACRACDFAQKCLGERAIVSDFPIVDARQMEISL
jgi:hypothetical protein